MMLVVNVRHAPFDVYVGRTMSGRWAHLRDTGWGNPFRGVDAVGRYSTWVQDQPDLMARLPELRGQVLGCWCAPPSGLTGDDPWICHGQVLAWLVDHPEAWA
jgi:hypothetical protein